MINYSNGTQVDKRDTHSVSKMVHLPQTRTFFGKSIDITLMYFWVPFIKQKQKKSLEFIQSSKNASIALFH